MKAMPILFVAAMMAAFLLGFVREPPLAAGLEQGGAIAPSAPKVVHAGETFRLARDQLATARIGTYRPPAQAGPMTFSDVASAMPPGEPPPDLPVAPPPPPPPPPVDIATHFGRDLSAVMRGPGGPVLVLVDSAGGSGRRVLKPGQGYRDGWRVQKIERGDVVLAKGRSTRRIPISRGVPPPEPVYLPPAPTTAFVPPSPAPAAEAPPAPAEVLADPAGNAPLQSVADTPAGDPAAAAPVNDGASEGQPVVNTDRYTPKPRRRIRRSGNE